MPLNFFNRRRSPAKTRPAKKPARLWRPFGFLSVGSRGGSNDRSLQVEPLEQRKLLTATVTTDLADYAPGSTAHFVASGFLPGEKVDFQVLHIDGRSNAGSGHLPWAVADGGTTDLDSKVNGSVSTTVAPEPRGLGRRHVPTPRDGRDVRTDRGD